MKKTLKTFALVTVAFTAGEFVTMWRMREKPETFKEFIKNYWTEQNRQLKHVDTMYERLADGDTAGAKKEVKILMFPHQEH